MDMHMPVPGPEHENLAKLAGEWSGEETMFASAWCPEERKVFGRIKARVLENFFVVSDYEQKHGDQVSFRGHGVYAWDPQEKQYVMYWFDSMGGPGGIAKGRLEGNQLTFRNTSPMGHHRYRYTFGDGTTTFEMSMSADGKAWNTLMVGHYTAD